MMRTFQSSLLTCTMALFAVSGPAFAQDQDIVDTAVAEGSFKTLASALDAVDLVDTLKKDGPFTVFAPTDEAFAKLPEGTLETLLKPENRDQLIDILTYHVVDGEVPAAVAVTLDEAKALNEKVIQVTLKDDALFLNDSKVIQPDVKCSNGVIHVIDTVLIPPAKEDKKMTVNPDAGRDLVRMAIQKGVPLYNHGQHAACAAVYEVAGHALMTMPEGTVSTDAQAMIQSALDQVSQSHCSTTNAWTMRRAFDAYLMAETDS